MHITIGHDFIAFLNDKKGSSLNKPIVSKTHNPQESWNHSKTCLVANILITDSKVYSLIPTSSLDDNHCHISIFSFIIVGT